MSERLTLLSMLGMFFIILFYSLNKLSFETTVISLILNSTVFIVNSIFAVIKKYQSNEDYDRT